MAFSRALGVIGIVTVSWLAAVGCGDDDGKKVQPGEAGGEGGEAPAGGKSSAGGSTSNGGGGKSSGGGGTSSAGDGGAGLGGAPPTVDGGAGGEPVTPSGGAAGDGGAGGEAPVGALSCGNECEVTADCQGVDAESRAICNQETKRCEDPFGSCQVDADCLASASTWVHRCQSDADCGDDGTQTCVDFAGTGFCATLPDAGDCGFFDVKTMPRKGADGNVDVCADTYGRCFDGKCDLGCDDPLFFGSLCDGSGNGDTCDENSGRCTCVANEECASNVCGANSLCVECATTEHCTSKGLDTCVLGKCGCGSAASCPDNTQAGIPVCE
jgi:hypothetical protein